VAASYLLAANPTTLAFGNVNLGNTGSLNVTLTNNGNSNVTVSSVSVSGTRFSATGVSAGTTLPNQSVSLNATLFLGRWQLDRQHRRGQQRHQLSTTFPQWYGD